VEREGDESGSFTFTEKTFNVEDVVAEDESSLGGEPAKAKGEPYLAAVVRPVEEEDKPKSVAFSGTYSYHG